MTGEPNLTGEDRNSGVFILLSQRFASRQLQRGRLGRRGCYVRIQGATCNLLIICVYFPPFYSNAPEAIRLLKKLKELLDECSLHDCVILMGDFNLKFPRRYKFITGPYANRECGKKLRTRTRELLRLFESEVQSLRVYHVLQIKEEADEPCVKEGTR